jgi:hypothetical protein
VTLRKAVVMLGPPHERTVRMSRWHEGDGSTSWEVLVRGELSDDLVDDIGARHFERSRGKTVIFVDVIDQSHLHGVLGWLQDHNVDIERVNPI